MAEHTLPPKPVEKKEHSVRKSNKPLMEKRRRARINSCLGQLKTLVLQALKKDISQYSKLEKADILEMTVRHLRQLQREQISAAMATDPTVVTKYRAGFSECASEVMRYMSSVHGVSEEVRSRITNHLAGCIQVVNSVRKSEPITCTQPLHVQIPSALTPSSQAAGSLLMPVGLSSHTIVPCRKSAPVPSPPSKISSQISGSFQIIPGNFSGSAVAVYLGPTNGCSPLQSSDTTARPTAALPLYSIQVPNTTGNPPAYIPSPTTTSEQSKSEPERADLRNVISPVCSPNSFKDEHLWRPW